MGNFRKTLFALVLVLLVGAGAVRVLFPFQLYQFSERVELWRAGVGHFESLGMKGLFRDHCDPQDPEARGCTCVALIHGLGDEPETWKKLLSAPKSAWRKPVRLYALDIPRNQRFALGDSPESYRVRNQAAEIEKTLAPLCPSWVIVGNSLGGWEAAWIALDGKLQVQKLVFIDGAGTRSVEKTEAFRLFSKPTVESMHELVSRVYFKPHPLPDAFWKKAAEMTAAAKMGEILKAQTEEDFLDGKLASLRVPTMVLWGASDHLIPDTIGKEVQAQIPSSVWREIPECGHVPQKECPVPVIQAINDMIRVGTM